MKKQKWKKLFLALAVLVLLLAVYLILQKWNRAQEETEETEASEQIVSLDPDEIGKLTVKNQSGSLTFVKLGDAWSYEADAEFPLNQETLDGTAETLKEVTANRRLEDGAELSEYGLDSPALQITVEKTDGTELTLQIGDENGVTGDYYAKLAEEDTIYTIGSSVASAFEKELYDYAVEDDFPEISSADVDGITIEKADGTQLLFTYEDSSWTVSDGSRSAEADSAKMSELTAAVGSLAYDSYVDYHAEDLTGYGLDQPAARVTIAYTTTESSAEDETDTEAVSEEAEETETGETDTETAEVPHQVILEVGSVVPEKTPETEEADDETGEGTGSAEAFYYVKLADAAAVHTVSGSALSTWLNASYADCLDSCVSNIPITGMSALKVTYGRKTYELTYQAEHVTETDSTEYIYYVDGKEADTTRFTQFCNGAAAVRAQSRMEKEPEDAGEAVLVLEYEKTDGTKQKVSYIPYENGLYLAEVTGRQPGLVSKLDVESLIGDFEELIK